MVEWLQAGHEGAVFALGLQAPERRPPSVWPPTLSVSPRLPTPGNSVTVVSLSVTSTQEALIRVGVNVAVRAFPIFATSSPRRCAWLPSGGFDKC